MLALQTEVRRHDRAPWPVGDSATLPSRGTAMRRRASRSPMTGSYATVTAQTSVQVQERSWECIGLTFGIIALLHPVLR
jgi:hypothetical protein